MWITALPHYSVPLEKPALPNWLVVRFPSGPGLKHTKQKSRNGEIRVMHTLNKVHSQRTCKAIVIRTRQCDEWFIALVVCLNNFNHSQPVTDNRTGERK